MKENFIGCKLSMRKRSLIFSKLLVLFFIIFSLIAMTDTGLSEENEALNVQKNVVDQAIASPKPESAPESPDFINYQNNKISSQTETPLAGYKPGIIPSPVDISHLSSTSSVKAAPPTYYDLRTLNKVTPVKDQGSAGACWAFATYGSLESCLKPGETWDFSENNMKNLLSSAYSEGFDRDPNGGGNIFMSTAYLSRWSGPVAESDDPYDPYSLTSPLNMPVKKHVQNMTLIPDRKNSLDNDGIKQAIQNYGAVYTSMYCVENYYSPTTYCYYYNGTSLSNHAVTIVGWNDSFDKNKFSKVPPGNGAFIVKNSWGTGWGDKGYFYVSYYDSNIGKNNAILTAETTGNYKNIYQYDPLGWSQDVGYQSPSAWCANVFTSKSNEALKAVSFYTTDSNSNYQIYIYTNPSSGPINQAGPTLTRSGTAAYAGYHTVPLGSTAQFLAGQKFSVVLKLTTSGYGYPIPTEAPILGYSSKAKANSGESFISSDGSIWTDVTTSFPNTNVCIKAFTDTNGSVPLVANFTSNVTSGIAPLNVAFIDKSTGTPASWNWTFGDGTYSTAKNVTHTYSKAGNYTVALKVSNSAGSNTTTKTNYIKVTSATKPVANFTSNVTSGIEPLTVSFSDRSTNIPTSWRWTFGDGTNSTSKNPVHRYSTKGNYTVSLTVTNAAGSNTTTKTNYVRVAAVVKPVANFTSNVTSGIAPLTVSFNDRSINNPTSWRWTFGDGTNSTSKNPIHKYTTKGNYTVSLTATNAAGSNTTTKTNYIRVAAVVKPVANFTSNVTSGTAPLTVLFSDKSINTPTSWRWTFGDGTNSTSKNPVHRYSTKGNYTVSLTAINAAGSNTTTKTNYVKVTAVVKPVANFTSNVTSGYAPLSVAFTDKSTNNPTAWKWTFGDGTNSTVKNPFHRYSIAGNYTVTLTASNSAGSSTITKANYIKVIKK